MKDYCDILRRLVETSDCFIYQILRLNVFLQKHNATENVSCSTATILIVETNYVQVCDLVSSVLHNLLNATQVHSAFSLRGAIPGISSGKKETAENLDEKISYFYRPLEDCCQCSCNELAKHLYLCLCSRVCFWP